MKYIEIDSYGKKIQFTTRSVFIDGKEYPYSQMSSVRYSLEKKVYAFKCGDEVQYIRYKDKDEKALSAIFSQIRKLHQKRDAAAAKAVVPSGVHAFSVADVMDGKDVAAADTSRFTTRISVQDLLATQEKEAAEAGETVVEAPVEEVKTEIAEAEEPKVDTGEAVKEEKAEAEASAAPVEEIKAEAGEETKAEAGEEIKEEAKSETGEATEETKADAKETAEDPKAAAAKAKADAKAKAQEEKEKLRAEKEKAKQEKAAAKAKEREEKAKAKQEKAAAAGESGVQSKFKKAIIIFVVILLFFVALGAVWYATVGLSSNSSAGPSSTESQSYDDIDQMIEDLEE